MIKSYSSSGKNICCCFSAKLFDQKYALPIVKNKFGDCYVAWEVKKKFKCTIKKTKNTILMRLGYYAKSCTKVSIITNQELF